MHKHAHALQMAHALTVAMSRLAAPAKEWLVSLALPHHQALPVARTLASLALTHKSFEDTVREGADTLLALLPLESGAKHAVETSLAALKVRAMPHVMITISSRQQQTVMYDCDAQRPAKDGTDHDHESSRAHAAWCQERIIYALLHAAAEGDEDKVQCSLSHTQHGHSFTLYGLQTSLQTQRADGVAVMSAYKALHSTDGIMRSYQVLCCAFKFTQMIA
jgi:hypothetical protein